MNDQEQTIERMQPLHELNLDSLAADGRLQMVHQEGNFLVGTTDKGVRFRQRIKPGKMLTKVDGKFKIVDMPVV